MMVKLATSRLPPQTMLNFKQKEIFLRHKFAWGGEGVQEMDAKPSQKYIFSSSRVLCRN